jgi:hypothetical protein
MTRPRNRAPTIAEVGDFLTREARRTVRRAERLRRELDNRFAAYQHAVRDLQRLLSQTSLSPA